MFRFYALLVAVLLSVVTASPIRRSTDLEPINRALYTALRYGSFGSSGGRDDDRSSEKGDDDSEKGSDEKSRGETQSVKSDDKGLENSKEHDDDDKQPRGWSAGRRGNGPKSGNGHGNGRGSGLVVKCDAWDPDCRESDEDEKSAMKEPGNRDRGKKNNGIKGKGPRRGRGSGQNKGPRQSPVKKCDPWDPDCGMGKDNDEPACDPWYPDCGMKDDDEEPACDPWDPDCGKFPFSFNEDDDHKTACDPWKDDCKRMTKFPRWKGPRGPKTLPGGRKGNLQGQKRRNNDVRHQRGPKKGSRGHGRKPGHSHGNKGDHSHGNNGGSAHGKKGGHSH